MVFELTDEIGITSVYKTAAGRYQSAGNGSHGGHVSVLDGTDDVVDCYDRQNDRGSDRAGVHSGRVSCHVCGHADRQNDRDRVRDIEARGRMR